MLGTDRRGYTVEEAARLLQFHPDSVRYWLRVGQLSGIQLDGQDEWLIGLDALVAFLRQNGETGPDNLLLPLAS